MKHTIKKAKLAFNNIRNVIAVWIDGKPYKGGEINEPKTDWTFYQPAEFKDDTEDTWVDPIDSNLPLVCKCGHDNFTVHYVAAYQTNIKCVNCGLESCVHSG